MGPDPPPMEKSIFVQLGPNLSWGFGPKVNTKLTLETTTTHHPPSPLTHPPNDNF